MKIKVINESLEEFNQEFKVISINYDNVMIKKQDKKVIIKRDDAQLISENSNEDIILQYKDILKIKLDRGISLGLYKVLVEYIEDVIKSKIQSIALLYDNFEYLRKGIWEKNIVVVVNDLYPLYINIIGRKFGRNFDVSIKEMSLKDFTSECIAEIEEIKKQIEEKEIILNEHKKALKNVINNNINKNTCMLLQ